jgi:biopolymer transport protein ExbD
MQQGPEIMQADSGKSYDDINITPMVDLYLVLLLIFIIMTTAGVQAVKVNLPKAGSPANAKVEGPKLQAITVNNEGKVFLNTIPVSFEELEQKLNGIKSATPDVPVIIRGDSQTQYQVVMDVIDVIGRVGISQINLATQPPKK